VVATLVAGNIEFVCITPAEQAEARRLLLRDEPSHRLQGFGEGSPEADMALTASDGAFTG
jgi:hypothetical protein